MSTVSVDAQGNYTALATGFASINVYGYDSYGSMVYSKTYELTVKLDMSGVTLDKTSLESFVVNGTYDEIIINVLGGYVFNSSNYDVNFSVTSSNTAIEVYSTLTDNVIRIHPYGYGSTVLQININDKIFSVPLTIHNISISADSVILAKGKKKTVKVKGITQNVRWSSSNKKVASVSSKGVIKGKKSGNAIITANIGDKKIGCVVSVVSAKMVKVIKRAQKIAKTCKYSQAKRMQSGYYDCSSLVWKSYSKYGIYPGSRSYAPTAADLAKWCASKKKIVSKNCSYNNIQKMKYRPGDVMFKTVRIMEDIKVYIM